jgi:hypothetical protein
MAETVTFVFGGHSRHYLHRRIDKRGFEGAQDGVGHRQRLILRQIAELKAQGMGDQLQQIISRPDQGAVIAHPSTLADIEHNRNILPECETAAVAHHQPAHAVAKTSVFEIRAACLLRARVSWYTALS